MWHIASLQSASERVATQEIEQQTLVEDWASDIRLNWVRTEAFLKAIDRDYMDKLTADTQEPSLWHRPSSEPRGTSPKTPEKSAKALPPHTP